MSPSDRIYAVALFDLRLQSAGYDVKLSPDLDDDPRQLTSRFFSSILDPLLSSEDGDVDRSIGIFSKFRAKNEGACDEQRGPRSIGHDSAIAHVSTPVGGPNISFCRVKLTKAVKMGKRIKHPRY